MVPKLTEKEMNKCICDKLEINEDLRFFMEVYNPLKIYQKICEQGIDHNVARNLLKPYETSFYNPLVELVTKSRDNTLK